MTRTILIYFLTLIVFSSKGQNYEFNLLAQYKITVEDYKYERTTYANSKDDSYFLSVDSNSGKLKGVIYDLKKFMMYNYSVTKSKVSGETYFDFSYIDSIPIKYHKSFYKYQFTKSEVIIDSISKKMTVNAYEGSKRKRPKMSLTLEMKKNTENLFPLFRFSCFHPFELLSNLNFPGNYLVEKADGFALSGNSFRHQLLEFKEVSFTLKIPKS
jgi:hypothetical protein